MAESEREWVCAICGHVSVELKYLCRHQMVAVLDLIDEMQLEAEVADAEQEYREWAQAYPEKAEALHRQMEKVVQRAIQRARAERN